MEDNNRNAVDSEVSKTETNEKPVLKVRGTATFFSDNTFEFVAQKEGKPKQKDVKRVGDAKLHTTTGANPKRVITMECPADVADPATVFANQFAGVMKDEFEKNMPDHLKPTGTIIKNEDDFKMTVNKKKHSLEVSFIVDLRPEGLKDFKIKFYDKLQELSKCFAINENIIRKSK